MLLGGLSLLHRKCQTEENPSLFAFQYVKKILMTKMYLLEKLRTDFPF